MRIMNNDINILLDKMILEIFFKYVNKSGELDDVVTDILSIIDSYKEGE